MKNKKTNTTAKRGVNFVRTIVEDSECFFHKIEQESDLGIDAIIEFIKDERPLNKCIAIQIKSGPSYYNSKNSECIIPIDSHREYWKNYPLPVFGIVYIPELKIGYWIDIKYYLDKNRETNTIRFVGNRANQFDTENYKSVFVPRLTNKTPEISFESSLQLFDSNDINEFMLGSIVLFRRYINKIETWERIIDFIIAPENIEIPRHLIYYLAHIPWHPDIYYTGESINKEIKEIVLKEIKSFDKSIMNKLLLQIDEEEDIARGTIGQSIEAIISRVENKKDYLEQNMVDNELSIHIRQLSALLYGYYYEKDSLDFLRNLDNKDMWITPGLIEQIEENGWISIY